MFFASALMAGLTYTCLADTEWRGVHVMAWGSAGGNEGLPALKRAIDETLVPLGDRKSVV